MTALLARGGAAPGDRIAVATRAAAVLAGVGLLGALVFGGLWWYTASGPAATASARDDVLVDARQIAVNLQTLDYQTVDKGLGVWEASATGPLLDEFRKNHQKYADQMRAVQTSATARLIDIALADFDPAAGKARAVAAVDVSATQLVNGVPSLPVTKQMRIQLELVRTPDAGWKASAASAIRS